MRTKVKSQKSKVKSFLGFTLVELLVSSAIFITVSTIIVTILSFTFRVNQRTELTVSLRNNGNNALSQMSNALKYASSLDASVSCSSNPVPSQEITFTSSFDEGITTLSCQTGDDSIIASNGANLINTNVVSVESCSFTCSQRSLNDPPTITIKFELSAKNLIGSGTSQVLLPFQTAVTMRNFIR